MKVLGILLSAVAFTFAVTAVAAPLYWTPYEYNYMHDDFIPEAVFQKNVDWVASTFATAGYGMVVTDGWIYGNSQVNGDGYIVTYNNSWQHGYAYWSQYLKQKGLSFGVYFNPLWVLQSAYTQNLPVQGTSYRMQDIAASAPDGKYEAHWVDPSKPGAKEFVEGYVRYFKNLGVKLLRVDFLCDFEKKFGSDAYALALSWMREAAGDDLVLSLVMPNSYNLAATESLYGDMLRVSEDTFVGGWAALSGRERGQLFTRWPRLHNAFDGFVYFSQIPGRMILDGDAIRMNTFASDVERKTCISLYTMAGSPIPIADQKDTIGNSTALYENAELIALSRSGFIGKPLSTDLQSADSQRWLGQDAEGNWIVGLFNRESTAQVRAIDFSSELGISGAAQVRDLWTHEDLTPSTSYSVKLAPHESRVLRVTAE